MVYTIDSKTNNSIHNHNANQDHEGKNTKLNGCIGCKGCIAGIGGIGGIDSIGGIGCISCPFTGFFKSLSKVESTSPSSLEAHAGFFRLSLKGKFDDYGNTGCGVFKQGYNIRKVFT